MLLSGIWALMLTLAVLYAVAGGGAAAVGAAAVGAAALEGAAAAVETTLSLSGALLLWSGLQEALCREGVTASLGHALGPVLSRLFPSCRRDDELSAALGANMAANLLGLGNAATPAGIRAASLLQKNGAEEEMARLVVLNTASVQLFPATVGAARQALGSASPFDILPAVWAVSLLSVTAGLLCEHITRP